MEQKKEYKKPQTKEVELKYEAPLMESGSISTV
jgi:hypothetical protein